MRSIIGDGIDLLNRLLAELSKLYPGLEYRIATNEEPSGEETPVANPDAP